MSEHVVRGVRDCRSPAFSFDVQSAVHVEVAHACRSMGVLSRWFQWRSSEKTSPRWYSVGRCESFVSGTCRSFRARLRPLRDSRSVVSLCKQLRSTCITVQATGIPSELGSEVPSHHLWTVPHLQFSPHLQSAPQLQSFQGHGLPPLSFFTQGSQPNMVAGDARVQLRESRTVDVT